MTDLLFNLSILYGIDNISSLLRFSVSLYISYQGGVYLVNFLNVYGPGLAILFVVFVEAAGVFWFYGVENFSSDIEQMLGKRPSLFWRICWKYISPTFLFVSIQANGGGGVGNRKVEFKSNFDYSF